MRKLGVPHDKISRGNREDNFWGPTGDEGPCGPTVEFHINGIEIWNLVFNEYYQDASGKLSPLKQKGVDTGMGLERLAIILQDVPTVFDTDLFKPLIEAINTKYKTQSEKPRFKDQNLIKYQRIIADHLRGAVFLIADGVLPSNLERGYILRRIIRRAMRYVKLLKLPDDVYQDLVDIIIDIYHQNYPELREKKIEINSVLEQEINKFSIALSRGLREFEKMIKKGIGAKEAFDLYQTYSFPFELTQELAKEYNIEISEEEFKKELIKHQEISRVGAEKKFGGHGISDKEADYKIVQLHTATHLLHQALRDVLGEHIQQMGSDINSERLRFDFTHSEKMTEEQIKKVEEIVNQKIQEDLPVKKEEMTYEDAVKSGALAFFKERYPERVSVYSIGNYSREICAGPHVEHTGELGKFKIIKEQSSAAGVRRIKAILE